MMIGAAYIRVSTDDQTEYSPEAQLRALREYAKRNEILLMDEYVFKDEGVSGRKADKRPGFQLMISTAKKKPKPFDIILVHKFDRFARNREDSVVYKSLLRKEYEIKVVSITEQLEDDKFSIILESMLEAMAEYYSLNLADEVKKGMFEKARRGENIGKAPFGYDLVDKKLIPNEEEAETIRLIFKMYETESITKISKYLNTHGYATKIGGDWTPATLLYILQNPVYYGKTRYNYRKGGRRDSTNPSSEWIIADASHDPLITEEIFISTQMKLEQNSNFYSRNLSSKELKSWVQHVARCVECGSTLTISSCSNQKYRMYRCPHYTLGRCSYGNTYSTRKLEKQVLERLMLDAHETGGFTICSSYKDDTSKHEINQLNRLLQRIENKRELIKKAYLAEIDSLEEYKLNKAELQKEELDIRQRLVSYSQEKSKDEKCTLHTLCLKHLLQLLEGDTVTLEKKNRIVKQFIKEVRVDLRQKEIRIIYYI